MNPLIFVKKGCKYIWRECVLYSVWHFVTYFPMFQTLMYSRWRAKAWRFIGAKVGKKVFIGYGVYIDVSTLHRLTIEDYVGIGAESLILLHKIDMKAFRDRRLGIPIKEGDIRICKNVQIGMRSFILPGVTIGEGSFVAANSVVTHDVPPYTVVAGNPAKVISEIKPVDPSELPAE